MSHGVVILSREGSLYGGMVLESAVQAGLDVTGVVLQRWSFKQKYRRFRSYVGKHGLTPVVLSKGIAYLDGSSMSGSKPIEKQSLEQVLDTYSIPTFRVPTLNGEETLTCLKRLKPKAVLLGGVGIVSADLIEAASNRVLNAHPGVVPQYRGNYVVRWAVLAGDPVGITVHKVDSSIDTGDILSITMIDLPEIRSLIAAENYVDVRRAELLARESKRFLAGEIDPSPQQSHSDMASYSMMPPSKLWRTYRALARSKNHHRHQT